jgi:hypothetical protein
MKDTEWQTCDDVRAMLDHLATRGGRESEPGLDVVEEVIGERKLGLFAVACCRRVDHHLVAETTRNLVDAAEQFFTNQGSEEDLAEAVEALLDEEAALEREELGHKETQIANAADIAIIMGSGLSLAYYGAICSGNECYEELIGGLDVLQHATTRRGTARAAEESARQADLLRDMAGNPFRRVTINQAWLRWKDRTVAKLAESIFEERRFVDLPVLADALEEAGCTDRDLLDHLRGPGPHVPGCWAVDLLLDKK